MKRIALVLFLGACLLLAGCSAKGPQEVSITLPGNATTGFEWNYMLSAEGIIKEKSTSVTPDSTDEDIVGSGSQYTWVFESVAEGEVDIIFAYARSFEEIDPAFTLTYTFTVAADKTITFVGVNGDMTDIPQPVLGK